MSRRAAARAQTQSLLDALNALADALRGGASLRQALCGVAALDGSPFATVAAALDDGAPLVSTLHAAAVDVDGVDAGLASACCVLAVHAEAGGDPLPAVRALVDRLTAERLASDEARTLTTQARLGARAILLMTPAFLVLVAVADPGGAAAWFGDARTRTAIAGGLALQGLGAWWITAIIGNASGVRSRAATMPVIRALRAMVAGRSRSTDAEDVASCADITSLVLDAGLSPAAALSRAAPFARGRFGDAVRAAVAERHVVLSEALVERCGALGSVGAERFARTVSSAMDLGVPLAPALRSLADDLREGARTASAEGIRRASVRVLLPLGVLVLPAFVLACLVPLFVGGLEGLSTR